MPSQNTRSSFGLQAQIQIDYQFQQIYKQNVKIKKKVFIPLMCSTVLIYIISVIYILILHTCNSKNLVTK